MRALICAILLLQAGMAWAHPHPGGIVVLADGTVVVGDFLQPRLIVLSTDGSWREVPGVGNVRDLELAADGTIWGVSQSHGMGLWTLGADEQPRPVLSEFHGMFTRSSDGRLFLAAADPTDKRPRLVMRTPDGQALTIAEVEQIDALAIDGDEVLIAGGKLFAALEPDGNLRTIADDFAGGIHSINGIAIGPNGPIIAVQQDRSVVEFSRDGERRVLLQAEAPWIPTDAAYHDGALYVSEYSQDSSGWNGPRIRKLVIGQPPQTLLEIDTPHTLSPWAKLALAVLGPVALGALLLIWARRRKDITQIARR